MNDDRGWAAPPVFQGPSDRDIDDFVQANGIDDRAAEDFRSCPPEVQAKVLARGDLRDARNPSAMLLSRIKEARQDVAREGPPQGYGGRPMMDDRGYSGRDREQGGYGGGGKDRMRGRA